LDNFFEQWIYNEYYPVYAYGWYQNQDTLRYSIIQSTFGARQYDMPVDVYFNRADDTLFQQVRVYEDTLSTYFLLPDSEAVLSVSVDPENWILKKVYQSEYMQADPEIPVRFHVGLPYPNPFNPKVSLDFFLEYSDDVVFEIYNLAGNLVYSEVRSVNPGDNTFTWNGISNSRKSMASGVYLIGLRYAGSQLFRKALLIK